LYSTTIARMSKPISFSFSSAKTAAGGGLYSGISFEGDEQVPVTEPEAAPRQEVEPAAAPVAEPRPESNKENSKPAGVCYLCRQMDVCLNGIPFPAWSAALAFAPAPRNRKKPAAPASTAITMAALASAGSASPNPLVKPPGAPSPSPAPSGSSTFEPVQPNLPGPPPMTLDDEKMPLAERKVLRPPPMELDEDDVNGFRKTEAGRKLASKEEKRGRKVRFLDLIIDMTSVC
jgi:splicing factor 45